MLNLKIAYSPLIRPYFHTNRELVSVQETDFTDIGAIILSSEKILKIILIVYKQLNLIFRSLLLSLKVNF